MTVHEVRIWGLWLNGLDTFDIAKRVNEPEFRIYAQLHRILEERRLTENKEQA